ncbi:MAG: Rpp14/Pop5 family protein [Candidatus Woesearchaeota archaeon]
MKTKPLSPTLRERKRYLVYEVISESDIGDVYRISDSIKNSMKSYIGEKDLGKAGLYFLNHKFNRKLNRGIVRVENNHIDNLRSSLALVEKIDEDPVIVRSVGVSGILKKAEEKFLFFQAKAA